jgi:hypothetical protein
MIPITFNGMSWKFCVVFLLLAGLANAEIIESFEKDGTAITRLETKGAANETPVTMDGTGFTWGAYVAVSSNNAYVYNVNANLNRLELGRRVVQGGGYVYTRFDISVDMRDPNAFVEVEGGIGPRSGNYTAVKDVRVMLRASDQWYISDSGFDMVYDPVIKSVALGTVTWTQVNNPEILDDGFLPENEAALDLGDSGLALDIDPADPNNPDSPNIPLLNVDGGGLYFAGSTTATSSFYVYQIKWSGDPKPANIPPNSDAGPDRSIYFAASGGSVMLNGTADDGGDGPGPLTTTWSKLTGPGTVTFSNATILDPIVTFSSIGTYELALYVSDGIDDANDTTIIDILAGEPNDFFVASDGDDANPGTIDSPWATIMNALSQVSPGNTIHIRGGHYHEELDLGALKGEAGSPITVTAYNGEEVFIAGTEPVASDWTLHEGNIWKTTISEDIWQLFVDGKAMTEARWPNVTSDYMDPDNGNGNAPTPGSFWDRKTDQRPTFYPASGSTWGDIIAGSELHDLAATGLSFEGAVIKTFETKTEGTEVITAHVAGSNQFQHTTVNFPDNADTSMSSTGSIWLTTHLNCLDAPREWYYDMETKELYVWFEDGGSPQDRYIEGKTRTKVLNADGAEYIDFYGLTFMGGIFYFYETSHVNFDECRFLYCGYPKHMLKDHSESAVFNGTYGINDGDINWYNCEFAYNPGISLYIRTWLGHIVDNCYFHNGQWQSTAYGSVSDKKGSRTTIRRCTFHTMGRANATKNAKHGLIEYNHTYNFYFSADGSAHQVPTGAQSTTVLSHNWVHDLYSRNGIRFDGDPAGIQCHVIRCVSFRNTRGFRLKGDQHQIYNITAFDNSPKSDINIAHMKFYGYENPDDPNEVTNDPSFGWPKAKGRRGNMTYYGNENSIIKNIAGQIIDNWPLVTYGPYGEEEANYHFSTLGLNLKEEMRDPDNYDFRLKPDSILVDAGVVVPGVSDIYNGAAPDVGAYEYADPNYWIPGCRFWKATTPIPPDGSETVKADADLMWLEGRNVISNDVWFGTDPNNLVLMSNQTTNIFEPGDLEDRVKYYWRIDTVTAEGTVTGDLWTFMPVYKDLYPSFEPTDDNWVRKGADWQNCNSTELKIRSSNRYAFLKFDISSMEGSRFEKVILRMRAKNTMVNTKVHAISNITWTECTLNGLSYPSPGTLIAEHTDIQADQWYDFDVTSYVTDPGIYSLRLSTTGDERAWYSKESTYPPKFVVMVAENHSPYFRSVSTHEPDAFSGLPYFGTIADEVNDPDGDPMTITKVSGPDWLTISPDGTLTGTPGPENLGANIFYAQVEDIYGASDETKIDIVVKEIVAIDPDITGNGRVDLEDFAVIASQWLNTTCTEPDWCSGADLNGSGTVNIDDIKIMAAVWLE